MKKIKKVESTFFFYPTQAKNVFVSRENKLELHCDGENA